MNRDLLILIFIGIFGVVVLVVVWLESLLGYGNLIVIAPLILIGLLPLFFAAKRKYVLPPHRENKSLALLSASILGISFVAPEAIIGLHASNTFGKLSAAGGVIGGLFLTYGLMQDALKRTRER
jgi:sugar phosphate permease